MHTRAARQELKWARPLLSADQGCHMWIRMTSDHTRIANFSVNFWNHIPFRVPHENDQARVWNFNTESFASLAITPLSGAGVQTTGGAVLLGIKSNRRLSISLHLILVIALRSSGPYDKYNYKHKYKYKFRTKSDKYILHTTLIFLQSVACLPNLEQSVSQSDGSGSSLLS